MKETIFVNIYGGPSAGKSTIAALVFGKLKKIGYDAELVSEFAKNLIWEKRYETLANQVYVTIQQYHMISKLNNKVDIVVIDSPVVLGILYTQNYPEFYHKTLIWCANKVSTPDCNFLIKRSKTRKFNNNGRVHNKLESEDKDFELEAILKSNNIKYDIVDFNIASKKIVDKIEKKIKEK